MKNAIRTLGFAVIAAIALSFALTACDSGDNGTTPPAHTHQWGNWETTKAATCTTAGSKTRTCALDPSHTETEVIPIDPTAHNYRYVEGSGTAPTCTEGGNGNEVCTYNASHTRDGVAIPALGHDYEWETTTHATCSAKGIKTGICTRDANHTTTEEIPIDPDEHDWQAAPGGAADVSESIVYVLNNNSGKYVSLDLSGSTISRIYRNAFSTGDYPSYTGCATLIGITIPNTIQVIEEYAFYDCTNLTSIDIPSSVTQIKDYAFYCCSTGITGSLNLPSVSQIGSYAFYNCTGITSVTIPVIYSIAYNAFFGCTSITQVEMPASSFTGEGNFRGCTSLRKIILTGTGSYSTIADGSIVLKDNTELVWIPNASGSIVVPEGITTIGVNAFFQCVNLTRIELPATLTMLNGQAFYGCSGITEITLPQNLTTIAHNVLAGCTNLTLVKSLAITPPELNADMGLFGWETPAGVQIKVPASSVATYKAADGWSNYADIISAIE